MIEVRRRGEETERPGTVTGGSAGRTEHQRSRFRGRDEC